MRVAYLPEHRDYKQALDDFVAGHVRPLLDDFDLDDTMTRERSHELWDELFGNGILDEVPRDADGALDWTAAGILLESLAYGNGSLSFMALSTLVFPALTFDTLTPEQQHIYGHLFARGQFLAGAYSEPGAGSNPAELRTTARRVDGEWVVNGTKLWISGAHHSDGLLLNCLIDEGDGSAPTMGQLLLDRAVTAYETNVIDTIGLRAHGLCEVVLDDVRAPLHAHLSADAANKTELQRTLQRGRLLMAAIAVGMAQRALDITVNYAGQRTQFGRSIAGFQLIQELLAQMYTDVTLARVGMFYGFSRLDEGHPVAKESSMAKAYATEAALRVANAGIQVHGAMGLSKESEIETIVRDARMCTIPDGTTQIHSLIIGRDLTGRSAFAS
ncbi:acyl-CoA dehydrogenase family protein [Rhodococcus sp. NPDC057529]|uniref:acyl-CoA dehydrogenase family protein n=1 Tax=Rhodococcus sp. NPDC057529 TaxID=3346158 RepID=UPI00366E64A8